MTEPMTDTAQGDEIEGLRKDGCARTAARIAGIVSDNRDAKVVESAVRVVLDAAVAELASLRERLAKAEGERDEAQADLSKLMDPELKHLRVEDGGIDLALTGPIVQHMGQVICEHFRASGAENYIEMTYTAKTEPFEAYVWTIQKRVGRNSPHDLRAKAEARALLAEGKLAEAKGALEANAATLEVTASRLTEMGAGSYEVTTAINETRAALSNLETQETRHELAK